jgi:Na+-transporting NADH:ubiquinone oxidoreductase subunit A
MYKIKKGLNIPLVGDPEKAIYEGKPVKKIALVGPDYVGMKPSMKVNEGDKVKVGQVLFECKKLAVKYTSPAGGVVSKINRGAKRIFQSVVIDIAADEEFEQFPKHNIEELGKLSRSDVVKELQDSGQWSSIRARPFSKAANPENKPNSIFITAMDSSPLSADASLIISQRIEDFENGLKVLAHLTEGDLHVCYRAGDKIPGKGLKKVRMQEFSGPHPSGLVGTHIHMIDPVGKNKLVWHLNYQDVMAIGYQFIEGKLDIRRVVSLAGPQVEKPRIVKTRIGACLEQLTDGELKKGDNRVISGSVLSGRTSQPSLCFLGRYHQQVSVILEGREREFLGWMSLGLEKFSIKNIYLTYFNKKKQYAFTSTTHGSPRSMVPIGCYEKVVPLQTNATFLLRSLLSYDTDLAQDLGALELDEEDLSLCTFVCPGKTDYGPILRQNLTKIEVEG